MRSMLFVLKKITWDLRVVRDPLGSPWSLIFDGVVSWNDLECILKVVGIYWNGVFYEVHMTSHGFTWLDTSAKTYEKWTGVKHTKHCA